MHRALALIAGLLPVLASTAVPAQSVEGGSVRVEGNLIIGGMSFPGGSADLRERILEAGYACETISGFTVLPEGLIVACDEEAAYRILPDAAGEPIIAPN
jgi:hypothetical protein